MVEVTGNWRRWQSEDIRDLYCLPNVILLIISRRTGVLVCGVDGVGAYCGLWWGMNQLIALGIYGGIIKMEMQEIA